MKIPCYNKQAIANADVAELADALASGASGGNFVGVQVPSSAPNSQRLGVDYFFANFRRWSYEKVVLASGNWSRFFEPFYHVHVEQDSMGFVTDFWNCAYFRLREEYAGLAAPGTEVTVSLRCTGCDVRSLHSAADNQILFAETLSEPAEMTATVTLTADAFEPYDCCPYGYELVMGESTQYKNTVFRVLRYLEDIEITEVTGTFCYYGQLVK